ncbi:MAG: hypothetical protein ACD_76C00094G0045 [uncultured bacterium]|nr:MAG: hypothetical protein ACD_76C00094G0045 [uncultured bacterium]HBD04905.1 hypothetical protein [Candidatus Uhrbacteria bacterium]
MEPKLDDLLEVLKKNYDKPDLDFIRKVYDFAAAAHRGQKRLTGSDYIVHPTATAIKLAEMRLDLPIVAAGLLHDVPEDTPRTLEDVREHFGDDIASMVEGVTKLEKVRYRGLERYAENLRKMFVAMASDIRVVFIKFCDRLHNMETLYIIPERKRERIAKEVLEIYAPVAHRLGMGEIRGQLEDFAFRYVYPKEYQWVKGLVEKKTTEKEEYLNDIISKAQKTVLKSGIQTASVHGRLKHLFSLYKKLLRFERDINKVHDLIAVRVIVNDVADCYAALGILHQLWRPLAGRIKDYIAQPKPNGYQSLHTTVFADNGQIVEFQIRTPQMHERAEYGIASHWQYKEADKKTKQIAWVEELAKIQKELSATPDFMTRLDEMKLDMFQGRIFVFTPRGDVIDLPDGSTPVDFAYAIHSDIGNKCVGARLNDQISNLDQELKSGDMCEIVLDKRRKGPNPDWLKFVKTSHARDHIRTQTKRSVKNWLSTVVRSEKETKKRK